MNNLKVAPVVWSYDDEYDLLVARVNEHLKYDFSVEYDNLVIDYDEEAFITGIRIFDAAKLLEKHSKKVA